MSLCISQQASRPAHVQQSCARVPRSYRRRRLSFQRCDTHISFPRDLSVSAQHTNHPIQVELELTSPTSLRKTKPPQTFQPYGKSALFSKHTYLHKDSCRSPAAVFNLSTSSLSPACSQSERNGALEDSLRSSCHSHSLPLLHCTSALQLKSSWAAPSHPISGDYQPSIPKALHYFAS